MAESSSGLVGFLPAPSLQSMAVVSIVTNTSKLPKFQQLIRNHCRMFYDSNFEEINVHELEDCLTNKLNFLPFAFQNEIANIVRLTVLQICQYMHEIKHCYPNLYESIHSECPCWTMHGIIDKRKTFELLLPKRTSRNITDLYHMACNYCMEEHIVDLWQQVPKEMQKHRFYVEEIYLKKEYHLIAYWTRYAKLFELSKLGVPFNCRERDSFKTFELSVELGNSVSVKFLWCKLTEEMKNENLSLWTERTVEKMSGIDTHEAINNYTDVLFFFLSQMDNADHVRQALWYDSHVILEGLLNNFPWQKILLRTIKLMWNFMDERIYPHFFHDAISHIIDGRMDKYTLHELWTESPERLRKCVITSIVDVSTNTLWNLLKMEDVKILKLILKDASVEEKEMIIESMLENRIKVVDMLTSQGSDELLDTFLRSCLYSEAEVEHFKECFTNCDMSKRMKRHRDSILGTQEPDSKRLDAKSVPENDE